MNFNKTYLAVFVCFFCSLSHAREIGVNAYYSSLDFDDNNGITQPVNYFSPYSVYFADKFSFNTRYWSEFYYGKTVLPASTTNIGQGLSFYGVAGAWQKNIRVSKVVKPWIGAGISYHVITSTKRHTVDREGFLNQRYADQTVKTYDLYLIGSQHWQYNKQWQYGIISRAVVPAFGRLALWSVGLSVNYH